MLLSLEIELRDRGYEVCPIAVSSEDAITAAAAEFPDIVLIDVGIYGKCDGITTAGKIQKDYRIPIVVLTGNPAPEIKAAVKRIRNCELLEKPIRMERLVALIERMLPVG